MKKESALLLKASWSGSIAEAMLLPIWALLIDKVGGTILDAGIGYALFEIVAGVIVIGVGSTKWFSNNVKLMILVGFALAGVCELAYLFATNIWEIFVIQSVIGIAVGFLNPAWDTLYSSDLDEPAKHWSFQTGGASFVVGISALIGGLIVNRYGWTVLFVAMTVCNVVSIYYAYKLWKSKI